jgi:hypothetical protein
MGSTAITGISLQEAVSAQKMPKSIIKKIILFIKGLLSDTYA